MYKIIGNFNRFILMLDFKDIFIVFFLLWVKVFKMFIIKLYKIIESSWRYMY